jgi:hypothetical protein
MKGLTDAELVAKANAICGRVNDKLVAASSSPNYTSHLDELAAYEHVAFAELGKLTPSAKSTADWHVLVGSAEALANDMSQLALDAQANDKTASQALFVKLEKDHTTMTEIAKRNGFVVCAKLS